MTYSLAEMELSMASLPIPRSRVLSAPMSRLSFLASSCPSWKTNKKILVEVALEAIRTLQIVQAGFEARRRSRHR